MCLVMSFSSFSAPTLATYGAGAGLLVLFFTSNWKGQDILGYVPVYKNKYIPKDTDMN